MCLSIVVYVFHILVIIFVLLPLLPVSTSLLSVPGILILHITFCIGLLVHWLANSNVCCLTLLESYLTGLEGNKTFTHRFISPVYNISATDWNIICYIVTILAILGSVYRLFHSERMKIAIDSLGNKRFFESLKLLFECKRN